jgi:hypothetical protein
MIRSFSLDAYLQMLSSDFLFPSNYQLRYLEDKGSLAETLPTQKVDIFDRGAEVDDYLLAKVARAVARTFVVLGIMAFVAPAGSIWHLYQTAVQLFMIVKDGLSEEHSWDKVRLHLQAFIIDTCLALPSLYLTSAFLVPSLAHPDLIVFTALISWIFPIYSGSLPHHAVGLLAWSEDTPGLQKSIILKNEFGRVSTNNTLLRADPKKDLEDREDIFSGHFGQIYFAQGVKFLRAIQKLQGSMSEKHQLVIHYPPTANQLEKLMNEHPKAFEKVDTKEEINKFKLLEDNVNQVQAHLRTFLHAQFGYDRDAPIRIPRFPCSADQCRNYCKLAEKSFLWDDDWVKLAEKAAKELKEIGGKRTDEERNKREKELPKEYSTYLKRVCDEESVNKFFGLELKPGLTTLGEAWKKVGEVLAKAEKVFQEDREIKILQEVANKGFEIFATMIII